MAPRNRSLETRGKSRSPSMLPSVLTLSRLRTNLPSLANLVRSRNSAPGTRAFVTISVLACSIRAAAEGATGAAVKIGAGVTIVAAARTAVTAINARNSGVRN